MSVTFETGRGLTTSTPSATPESSTPRSSTIGAALLAVLSTGAIFGFFYAWVVSTMWGLDDTDPRVAIEAMQAVNDNVRNAAFFPAFFLTPVLLGFAALMAHRDGSARSARRFGAAAIIYFVGGLVLTAVVHIPLNEELASTVIPSSAEEAATIWQEYSASWQRWNIARTVFSGGALAVAATGLVSLGRR